MFTSFDDYWVKEILTTICGLYDRIKDCPKSEIAAFRRIVRMAKAADALADALSDIAGVCQSDLETHFGKPIARKVTKALRVWEKIGAS